MSKIAQAYKEQRATPVTFEQLVEERKQWYEMQDNLRKIITHQENMIWDLEQKNRELQKQANHLSKTQARQFVDNQKLQVKAEKAKDVVNIDTARQIMPKITDKWVQLIINTANTTDFIKLKDSLTGKRGK